VNKLVFVPDGEFAYSYIVQALKKKKFIAKLYEQTRLTKKKKVDLDASLEMIVQLY